jgi:hypothetical protein
VITAAVFDTKPYDGRRWSRPRPITASIGNLFEYDADEEWLYAADEEEALDGQELAHK